MSVILVDPLANVRPLLSCNKNTNEIRANGLRVSFCIFQRRYNSGVQSVSTFHRFAASPDKNTPVDY